MITGDQGRGLDLSDPQVFGIAQADHELLSQAARNVHGLFRGDCPPDAAQQFAEIKQLITAKMAEHFAYEENQVFPMLLADPADPQLVQLVTELRTEHAALLAAGQRLSRQLHQRSLTKCTGELWTALLDFFTDLLHHSAKEDQLFESGRWAAGEAPARSGASATAKVLPGTPPAQPAVGHSR